MTISQLQEYVFTTKYARWIQTSARRETYDEAVDRVFAMHARRYAEKPVHEELIFAREAMRERLVLGSQRALQFGGKPVEDKHARLYNCTASYCDRPRFFQEALWLLLCGAGTGFSVQHHHIACLPSIVRPSGEVVVFTVPDSIEGWADALGVLMSSYFKNSQPHPEYAGRCVSFDFSHIRPAGAPLASGSGRAPGPGPLSRSLECIRTVIETRLADGGSPCRLRTIDCYDIVMHASDAVLSGGVRRSATICIFSPDDLDMAKAKTGDWFVKNPQRGRSNNSALLLRDQTTKAVFEELMSAVKECGEPGFVWADSTEIMYNPCVEIGLYPVDQQTGESGWAFCNLCEINLKACVTPEIFARAATAAAILGTLQAGYTDFPYLGEVTERIVRREALLGCSMTGMMDNPKLAFAPDLQREMAKLILQVNGRIAKKIGINPAARATCVKPAGTSSCILGTASGIHAHHARRYFRRVQANQNEAPLKWFQQYNPRAVEKSVWNPNGTDVVLSFCIEVPKSAMTSNDLSAIELLRHVELTQHNWVDAGRRLELCAQPWLRHNVSNTITVMADEWPTVIDYIFLHRHAFAGVSLLPFGGDLDYPQAPFCAVWTATEIVQRYGPGALMASGLIVDGLHAFANDLWAACACALGTGRSLDVPPPPGDEPRDNERYRDAVKIFLGQKDWIRRAHQFAKNYFQSDIREMTYCLKRVHNCKLWEDLTREYRAVSYTGLTEIEDDTTLEQVVACAGGACAII